MFGLFRDKVDYIGLTLAPPPDTMLFWYPWSTLQVERDGTLAVQSYSGQSTTFLQTFSWMHLGDDVLKVVSNEYNSDGTFRWKAVDVLAVTLRPGPGCDEVEELIEYLPGSGKSPATVRYLPGEICTRDDTPEDSKDCSFTFVECDGAAPPACTAEGCCAAGGARRSGSRPSARCSPRKSGAAPETAMREDDGSDEGEPAEQWLSHVLLGGSGRPQQGQPDVLLGQVELAIDHRWKFPLDLTKRAVPRSF